VAHRGLDFMKRTAEGKLFARDLVPLSLQVFNVPQTNSLRYDALDDFRISL
jgi:hypothetical protein